MYKIVRYYFKRPDYARTIKTGLTLEEAKAHCSNPASKGKGWFDGYTKQ